jgi:hypothetical protein
VNIDMSKEREFVARKAKELVQFYRIITKTEKFTDRLIREALIERNKKK